MQSDDTRSGAMPDAFDRQQAAQALERAAVDLRERRMRSARAALLGLIAAHGRAALDSAQVAAFAAEALRFADELELQAGPHDEPFELVGLLLRVRGPEGLMLAAEGALRDAAFEHRGTEHGQDLFAAAELCRRATEIFAGAPDNATTAATAEPVAP